MKSKLTKLITSIAMMLSISLPSFAHEFEVDGIYYSILSSTKKTVYVTYQGNSYDSYINEYTGRVTIPETVRYSGETYSVTSIGNYAFSGCSGLTEVTIPNSVTSISYCAFSGCSGLTKVTIPNSVTSIGSFAFEGCSGLTSVTIPNSVSSIGDQAFRGCSGLTELIIADGTENLSLGYNGYPQGLFYDCPLEKLYLGRNLSYNANYSYGYSPFSYTTTLKEVTIGNSVTSIGDYAFWRCSGLTSITIPNSVTSIGKDAFYDCSDLTSVTIGNSVTSIGEHAFLGCSGLIEVNITDLSAWCKIDFHNEYSNPLYFAENLKLNGKEVTDLVIPDGITAIKSYAFGECYGLTSVSIPNSVTSIGDRAFRNCSGLTSVTIPNSVTEIGNSAFYNCSDLTSVTIGNSVTLIGDSAFSGCSGLTSVTIPNSVTSIGYTAFSGCSGLTSINVESGNSNYDSRDKCNAMIETETNTLIAGCQNTMIPNSVTSIGDHAFRNCSGLTSVTIGDSVTSIGESAFYNCSGLTELTIPNSVTSIGKWVFGYCSGLTKVTIGNSVNSIGYAAFEGCSGLTSVTIGNSVTSIGEDAFARCDGLASVTIPNSVTSIGDFAFAWCDGLASVTIPNSVTSIGDHAFYGCRGLKYVDYNAKNLLKVGSDTNLSYAKIIIVGENVEKIPASIIDSSAATTIISKNTIPPVCDSNAFSSVNKSKCTLYVQSTSLVDYWSAEVWKEFANIKPLIEVSEISFDAENYKIETGKSLQINANIAPSEASVMDLIWTSCNPEVATVSSTGKVVGIKPGEATITARTIDGSNLTASCTVTVEAVLAKSIKLSQTEVELAPYESVVLTYTILPANTSNKSVTWSSSDESIATFKDNNDGSATVLMLKDDKAVITVTTNDGSNLSASCVVGKSSGVGDVYVEESVVTVEDGEIVVKNVTGIVTVYNITGIAVASETADGNEVRFDNLQPGVYIVVVNNKSVKVVL